MKHFKRIADLSARGFKADFWLAQTVGLLLVASGAALLSAARVRRVTREIALLGAGQAVVLGVADVYCIYQPRTTSVYLLYAILEAAITGAWLVVLLRQRETS